MRFDAWFLAVTILLLCSGLVVGQEENSGDTIQISIEVGEGLGTYAESIMDRVEENLTLHGVAWAIVDSNANVNMSIFAGGDAPTKGDEDVWISMQADTPVDLLISPLLYAHKQALQIPLKWDGNPRSYPIADWFSGLALYSIDRCDIALPYLQEAYSRAWRIDTYLEFYAGNCALLSGDYEYAAHLFNSSWNLVSSDGASIFMNRSTVNLGWAILQRDDGEEWDLQYGLDWPLPYVDCTGSNETAEERNTCIDLSVRIAQLYALAFDYDPAISRMDRVIAIAEDNMRNAIRVDAEIAGDFTRTDIAELYTLRGQMWLLLYEWDRVLEDYNTAIDLAPAYPDAYFYRGVLYYSVLQAGLTWREDALADFEYYLELAPDGTLLDQAQDYADTIRRELDALNN